MIVIYLAYAYLIWKGFGKNDSTLLQVASVGWLDWGEMITFRMVHLHMTKVSARAGDWKFWFLSSSDSSGFL